MKGDCFDGICAKGEVAIDCGGVSPKFYPPNSIGIFGRDSTLEPDLNAPLLLDPAMEYHLRGQLLFRDGTRLYIPARTVIKEETRCRYVYSIVSERFITNINATGKSNNYIFQN